MPAKQRFRAHDDQCVPPAEDPGQQGQSNASDWVDSAQPDAPHDVQSQLPAKEEILRLDRAARSHRQS